MTQQFERHGSRIDSDGRVQWALSEFRAFNGAVALFVPGKTVHLDAEAFYELREAINDLYDHIRKDTP